MGVVKSYSYDVLGRPVSVTSGGAVKSFEYSVGSFGNGVEKIITTDESGKTSEVRKDIVGNITAQYTGTNTPVKFYYNGINNLVQVNSPGGKVTRYTYDVLGNRSTKLTPDDGTTNYMYDKYGRLRYSWRVQDGGNCLQRDNYDGAGRIVSIEEKPNMTSKNADNDVATSADTASMITVNMYDKYVQSGVFQNLTTPSSVSVMNRDLNYKGRLVATAFRDKAGQGWNYKIYGYDHLGNVKYYWVKMGNNPRSQISKTYDNLGNVLSENIYSSHYVWYKYDKQGRLVKILSGSSSYESNAKQEASYLYDSFDRCSTLTYDQINSSSYKTTTYSYNSLRGWLQGISAGSSFTETLTYEDNGNVATQYLQNTGLSSTGNYSFIYDAMNRLQRVDKSGIAAEEFKYDPDGNILKRNIDQTVKKHVFTLYPGKNQLQSDSLNGTLYSTLTYDTRGNVTSDTRKAISGVLYSNKNLPLSLTSNGVTAKYRYDDNGQRIYKEYGSRKEYYLRDHTGRELAVYDLTTGQISSVNLYGQGVTGRVNVTWTNVWVEDPEDPGSGAWVPARTDDRVYYIKDHLGSVRLTVGQAGNLLSANDYYAYGALRQSSNYNSPKERFRFTEKERDTETSLDYFGARYLDSEYGRWMGIDPLSDLYPGISPYTYCADNPMIYIDIDGRSFDPVTHEWNGRDIIIRPGKPFYADFIYLPTDIANGPQKNSGQKYANILTASGGYVIARGLKAAEKELQEATKIAKLPNIKNKMFKLAFAKEIARSWIVTNALVTTTDMLLTTSNDWGDYSKLAIDAGIFAVGWWGPAEVALTLSIIDKAFEDEKSGGLEKMFNSHLESLRDPMKAAFINGF